MISAGLRQGMLCLPLTYTTGHTPCSTLTAQRADMRRGRSSAGLTDGKTRHRPTCLDQVITPHTRRGSTIRGVHLQRPIRSGRHSTETCEVASTDMCWTLAIKMQCYTTACISLAMLASSDAYIHTIRPWNPPCFVTPCDHRVSQSPHVTHHKRTSYQ